MSSESMYSAQTIKYAKSLHFYMRSKLRNLELNQVLLVFEQMFSDATFSQQVQNVLKFFDQLQEKET